MKYFYIVLSKKSEKMIVERHKKDDMMSFILFF